MAKMSMNEANAMFMKMSKRGKIITIFFMLAVGVGVVAIFNPGGEEPPYRPSPVIAKPDTPEHRDPLEVLSMAQVFVKRQLKAPASAIWPAPSESVVKFDAASATWVVVSYVDSQNSFGAMLRTNYIATLSYAGGGNYSLVDLQAME